MHPFTIYIELKTINLLKKLNATYGILGLYPNKLHTDPPCLGPVLDLCLRPGVAGTSRMFEPTDPGMIIRDSCLVGRLK